MSADPEEKERLDALEQALASARRGSDFSGGRVPKGTSIERLALLRAALRVATQRWPDSPRAWLLLSWVQESLLDYPGAISSIEKTMDLSGQRDKQALSRLARLRADEGGSRQRIARKYGR